MRKAVPSKRVAPGRTRANDPEGLRRRVLDAAASLFQSQGYAATGIHDIFDAAGVTSGAFYHHFASKKQLGLAVVRDARTTLDGVTAVFAAITRELDHNRTVQGCPANNLTLELAYADPEFRAELRAVFDRWREVIAAKLAEDMDRRVVRKRDTDALAGYIISVYSGAMALAKLEQRSRPLADCLKELSAALRPSAGGDPRS